MHSQLSHPPESAKLTALTARLDDKTAVIGIVGLCEPLVPAIKGLK